jgi:PKHD-type hydroxylase
MLLHVPDVLSADQVSACRKALTDAAWADGRVTAGHQSIRTKDNLQLPEDSPVARELGALVLGALVRNPLFLSAALPAKIFPPLFNCYRTGQSFGVHIDNAVRQFRGSQFRIRTDLSVTLFLSAPEEYDGGELGDRRHLRTASGEAAAGHLILYPASSLHKVEAITRGARIASFFWVQSMVRDDSERALLFDLDNAIQRLSAARPDDPTLVQLTGVYHNLLRRWSEL